MEIIKNILLWVFAITGCLTICTVMFLQVLSVMVKQLNKRTEELDKIDK